MKLTEFLWSCVDEDERRARSIKRIDPYQPIPFREVTHHGDGRVYDRFDRDVTDVYEQWVASLPETPDEHALAECAAKRAMITFALEREAEALNSEPWVAEQFMMRLALAYADRPGYREGWRPDA